MLTVNKAWKFKEQFPTVSAYTTTYNCVQGGYPFIEAIVSFAWADEVVVIDGGSTDGTREKLAELENRFEGRLKVYDLPLNHEDPGKDGALKALSRAMCMSEFLVQFDADEICMGEPTAWRRLAKTMPPELDILNLFVAEPYGSLDNLRVNPEHNPMKWRISRNKPEITHGIPKHDRLEIDGKVYSRGGSDGCFMINIATNEMYPSDASLDLKLLVAEKNKGNFLQYKESAQQHMENNPYVLHVGHVDLKKKISHYLSSWHSWWCQLYNKDPKDPQNNMYFPGVAIPDVTDEMVDEKVSDLVGSTPTVQVSVDWSNVLTSH